MNFKLKSSGLVIRPEHPLFGASPDAVGKDFVVEIKSLYSEKSEKR